MQNASKEQKETIVVCFHSYMMGNNITRVPQEVLPTIIGVLPQLTTTKMDSGIFAQVSYQCIVSQTRYRIR